MIDHVIVIVLTVMAVILLAGVGIMAVGAPISNLLLRRRAAVLTTAFVFIAAIVSFSGYFSSHG